MSRAALRDSSFVLEAEMEPNRKSSPKLVYLFLMATLSMIGGLLVAQSPEDQRGSRTSPQVRQLLEEEAECRELLQDLQVEQKTVQQELKAIANLLQLHYQLERLERQLESKKRPGADANALITRISETERQIDRSHQIRELRQFENHIQELLAFSQELAPRDFNSIAARLNVLASACEEIRRYVEQLPATTGGEDFDGIQEWTDRIDEGYEFVELVERYLSALEEDHEPEAEELAADLKSYLEGGDEDQMPLDQMPSDRPSEVARQSTDPKLLPVTVTQDGLAQFRGTDFEHTIAPLLREYCMDCHSNTSSYGDLNLESLVTQKPLVANRDAWINVIAQLKNRVMPPEDGASLNEEHRRQLVYSLHSKIHGFDYSQIKNPGFEVARRLTHVEYDNALSDLFGVPIRAAAKFPKELTGSSGFANSGNTLFLQPTLMERYIHAADAVVEELLPTTATNQRQRLARSKVMFMAPRTSNEESSVAVQIISRFATRAFRRPLRDDEQKQLAAQYDNLRAAGFDNEASIRAMVQRILVSPYFLLKFESKGPSGTNAEHSGVFRINDWELASRLSFFLWSTLPDDELLQLAERQELHQPTVLAAQVQRMLANPRAEALGRNFAAQWLGSEHIGSRVRLDPIDNPWCTDSLMDAMKEETALFVHSLIAADEPIERLIDADFTFLNRELANHYKIRGVAGKHMRRVDLNGQTRGGILGHASLLAVTSFPYRTSPVVRGKWILDTLLGTPPPPPPPNVSDLSEELLENERLTIRQKLEHHRRSPACAACHSEMDPLGLALEKYDWFGRFRERYERGRIDNRGSLPTGEQFVGLAGLKNVILETRKSDLVRQVTQRMLAYALGRQLEYYDEPAVRRIVAELEAKENRFQTLVQQIVLSFPFQYKQLPTQKRLVASNEE